MSSESTNRLVSAGQDFSSVYQSLLGLYDPHANSEKRREFLGHLPENMRQKIFFWVRGSEENPSYDEKHAYFLHCSLLRLQQAVQKVTFELFESLSETEKDEVKKQQQKLEKYVESMQTEGGRISNLLGRLIIGRDEGKLIALCVEQSIIQANKVIPATHTVPSVLAKDSIAPSNDEISDRKSIITKIYTTVSNCFPEHRSYVCAILYAKFECSNEEKEAIADELYSLDGIDVYKLVDNDIPPYKDASEAEQKAADEFLAYADGCLSHQGMGFRSSLKPEVSEAAPRKIRSSQEELRQSPELFQVNLGHLISLCRDVDPTTKNAIFLLESLHDCVGDLTPELRQILDIWAQEGGPDEKKPEAVDRCIKFLKDVDDICIDLKRLNLRSLPPIFDHHPFLRLKKLSLSGNQLTTLPEQFSALNNLSILNLGHNQLMVFPKQLTSLKNLEWLYLGHNELRSSAFKPLKTNRLKNLTFLDLEHNELTKCPSPIMKHLKELKTLNLGHNKIRIVSAQIFELSNLEILDCQYNTLTELSGQLGALGKLKKLSLRQIPH